MAIDPSLLIAAPILQDYFVDKTTGAPLSGGIVTLYQDNSRTTLKNWYYQSGSPLGYTYIPLPNPATLSDVGTIEDPNGNDTIPFFYPYSELDNTTKQPYYITVDNSAGQRQFTRQNFPFNPGTQTGNVNSTNENLIANNEFWRNIGSLDATTLINSFTLNSGTLYYATIAPSQHDGFTDMSDIQFIKNANGAVDTLTFEKFVGNFPNQIISDDITPEYYLNVSCTGAGSEIVKYIQIPIQLHVDSLSGVITCVAVIDAMAETGNPSITLGLFQFLGTGVTSPAVSILETIVLSNDWAKYTITFTMPSAQGLTLGNGGDDALYLQIGFPVAATFDINIAKPAVYLADDAPTNDWQTYDEVNAIISSPRTGDIRTSLNTFYPFGWVPMNGGTLCSPGSITAPAALGGFARQNIDAWPLFELIWNAFKPYDAVGLNVIAQMYDAAGATTAYGATSIGDWNALKQISLTKTMGQVILGTVPINDLLLPYKNPFNATNSGGFLQINPFTAINFFTGMPIIFSNTGGALPTGLTANTVYYVTSFNVGSFAFFVSTTFANAMAGTKIAYTNAGSGTNIVTAALAGTYEGEYAHTQLIAELAAHNHTPGAVLSYFNFNASAGGTPVYGQPNPTASLNIPVTSQGSSTPFNITQPGTFYNIYMKL